MRVGVRFDLAIERIAALCGTRAPHCTGVSLILTRTPSSQTKGSAPGQHKRSACLAAMLSPRGASRLDHRDGGNWEPRQVDDEDASPVRQVARIDPAIVGFDGPSAEGEAQAQAGAIGAALFERAE